MRCSAQIMQKGHMNSAVFISKKNELSLKIEKLNSDKYFMNQSGEYNDAINQTKRIMQIIKYNPDIIIDYDEKLFIHTLGNIEI